MQYANTIQQALILSCPRAQWTLATALDVAAEADDGVVILAMLPDTGERYLSTPLFEGVNEGSDDEWLESI